MQIYGIFDRWQAAKSIFAFFKLSARIFARMAGLGIYKKACIAGVCLCGFGRLPGLANDEPAASQKAPNHLTQDWLSGLLSNLDQELEEEQLRTIIKKLSKVHYDDLNMDRVLADYKGDLDKFIGFLEQSWGWRVDNNKVTKVLTADENKNYCVCPILTHKKRSIRRPSAIAPKGLRRKCSQRLRVLP